MGKQINNNRRNGDQFPDSLTGEEDIVKMIGKMRRFFPKADPRQQFLDQLHVDLETELEMQNFENELRAVVHKVGGDSTTTLEIVFRELAESARFVKGKIR